MNVKLNSVIVWSIIPFHTKSIFHLTHQTATRKGHTVLQCDWRSWKIADLLPIMLMLSNWLYILPVFYFIHSQQMQCFISGNHYLPLYCDLWNKLRIVVLIGLLHPACRSIGSVSSIRSWWSSSWWALCPWSLWELCARTTPATARMTTLMKWYVMKE